MSSAKTTLKLVYTAIAWLLSALTIAGVVSAIWSIVTLDEAVRITAVTSLAGALLLFVFVLPSVAAVDLRLGRMVTMTGPDDASCAATNTSAHIDSELPHLRRKRQ